MTLARRGETGQDLIGLLDSLDPQAELAARHLWLVHFVAWLRGDERSVEATLARLRLFLDAAAAREEFQTRLRQWWDELARTVDVTTLLADFGFAPRTAFLSELGERLRRKWLPATPQTTDAAELFTLVFSDRFDAQWIAAVDAALLERLGELLAPQAQSTRWHELLLEALTYCTSQVRSSGFAPELRTRMSEEAREGRPFHGLSVRLEEVRAALLRHGGHHPDVDSAALAFRQQLDACRLAAASVYGHLDDNGISVGLVFRLRQLRERIIRIRELLDALLSATPAAEAARLLARLVIVSEDGRSVRKLMAANTSLLAAKVTQRSAETGEHYITRTRDEYHQMLRKAAGGGALTGVTTLMKFAIAALGLSAFWGGFFAGLNYAISFVIIQLLHFTLATKQPAMTAPAMAAKLKDLATPQAVEAFVDEVTHLVRSQVASVIGNIALVVPAVVALSLAFRLVGGTDPLDAREVAYVWHSLNLLGPTLLFAAFTGVLLFASSIVAGWVENWFVLHRLDSALRYHPTMTRWLGAARAAVWARWLRENISGLAANISLGFMLGLVPAFAAFFGLGLDVRHVTLSAGQIAAAASATGWSALAQPALWWCVASIPLIGALNVGVSFWCALRVALRADNVGEIDRRRISVAIRARWSSRPLSFFWPDRASDAARHDETQSRP